MVCLSCTWCSFVWWLVYCVYSESAHGFNMMCLIAKLMPSVPRINAYVIMFEWHSPHLAAKQKQKDEDILICVWAPNLTQRSLCVLCLLYCLLRSLIFRQISNGQASQRSVAFCLHYAPLRLNKDIDLCDATNGSFQ